MGQGRLPCRYNKNEKLLEVRRRRRSGREGNRGSAQMKVEKLQRLVPGAGAYGLHPQSHDQLLLHTTHYIFYLRKKVSLLEALLKLHEP